MLAAHTRATCIFNDRLFRSINRALKNLNLIDSFRFKGKYRALDWAVFIRYLAFLKIPAM